MLVEITFPDSGLWGNLAARKNPSCLLEGVVGRLNCVANPFGPIFDVLCIFPQLLDMLWCVLLKPRVYLFASGRLLTRPMSTSVADRIQ